MKLLFIFLLSVTQIGAFADHWRAQRAWQQGDSAGAQELWSAIVTKNPHDISSLHGLAAIAYSQERYADACKLLDEVLQNSPTLDEEERALVDRAACYAKLQQFTQAEADLDTVLQKNPAHKKAAFNKRVLQLRSQEQQSKKSSRSSQDSGKTQQAGHQEQKKSDSQESQSSNNQHSPSSQQDVSSPQRQSSMQDSQKNAEDQEKFETTPESGSQQEASGKRWGRNRRKKQTENSLPQEDVGQEQSTPQVGSEKVSPRDNKDSGVHTEKQAQRNKGTKGLQEQEHALAHAAQDERLNKEQQELLQAIAQDEQTVQRHAIAHRAVKVAEDDSVRW